MLETELPLQYMPYHPTHGFDVVVPLTLHDQLLNLEILWIFVAAIKPHKATSWNEGHLSNSVDGRILWVTVVKHKGAQVINGFESPEDISIYCKVWILHKLEGTKPVTYICR